ncbi:hypothetical protein ACKKBF_B13975 [Auxenochlorella protothecoides x Auxenochlorella symbiontica]
MDTPRHGEARQRESLASVSARMLSRLKCVGLMFQSLPHCALPNLAADQARAKEGSKLGAKEEFAKMVGLDLFNFMQSFGGVQNVGSNNLLVPMNVLDAWYQRLERRLRKDPDFLTRQRDKV